METWENEALQARQGSELYVMFDPQTEVVWTSPNSCSIPKPIGMEEGQPIAAYHKNCRNPRWLFERYPFLAFWPIHIRWQGAIFDHLNIPPHWDGIVKYLNPAREYRYSMPLELMERWSRLEWALKSVSFHLMKSLNLKQYADMGLITLPEECGYKRAHTTQKFALEAIFRSRNAFIALTTYLSFAIALHIDPSLQPDEEEPWIKTLQDKKIHPLWLDDLRKSFVCDFMPSLRAGAFVKADSTRCGPFFEAFRAASVPIWICWGKQPPASMVDPQGMLRYMPTPGEVRLAKQRVLGSYVASSIPSSPYPAIISNFAGIPTVVAVLGLQSPHQLSQPLFSLQVERGSFQYEGEDPKEFHVRMTGERELCIESLAEEELESLRKLGEQAREENEDTELQMPSVGTSIYQWVFYPGGWRREMVSKCHWKDEWRRRPPRARHFYDFLEQWDLDPAEDDYASEDDDYEGIALNDSCMGIALQKDQGHIVGALNPETCPSGSSLDQGEEATWEDIHGRYGCQQVAFTPSVEPHPPLYILQIRYGFTVLAPYQKDYRLNSVKDQNLTSNPTSALERLGLKVHQEDEIKAPVLDLYNYAVSHTRNPFAFAPVFEDFCPSRLSEITSHPKFIYRRIQANAHIIGINGQALQKQWYLLALRSPMTICQLFREDVASILGMVRYLISWGIPFATVRCQHFLPTIKREPHPRLGFRKEGHEFDAAEYNAYEETKNDLLKGSVGRAALMRGGIVWRLAKEAVPIKSVTKGPSPGVKEDGYVWSEMDGFKLVDDSLSLRDEDVICGMYYVKTYKNQYEQRSWWPQSNTWEKSGYDLGYWTADCEAWYQKRLDKIKKGNAELHNATHWRKLLKRRPGSTKAFCDSMDQLSDFYLQGKTSYWRAG